MTSCNDSALGKWLQASGGNFHPSLEFRRDEFGMSVYAVERLPPHTSAVTCPFSLAITPEVARQALAARIGDSTSWTDHELMVTYLASHLSPASTNLHAISAPHEPYLASLPRPADMSTPLYFSTGERELLRGTNLYGAVKDRETMWKEELEGVRSKLSVTGTEDEDASALSWESWLWGCTIMSSRAFPSHLIPASSSSDPTPVLFPGVDTLNHRLGTRASWLTDVNTPPATTSASMAGGLSVVLDEGVAAGEQAFNTYGAKPTEELLLGYGFVLSDSNPADVVALKLPPPPTGSAVERIWTRAGLLDDNGRSFIDRSGILPDKLLRQMRVLLANEEELDAVEAALTSGGDDAEKAAVALDFISFETELDMLDQLESMLSGKLSVLPAGGQGPADSVRAEVKRMVDVYRQGQHDILTAALRWRDEELERVIARAEAEGFDLDFGDGEEE